jgi:hypothetical protein
MHTYICLRALTKGKKKKVGKMDEDKVTLESPVRTTTYFILRHIKKFTFCLNVAFVFFL